MVRAVLWKTDSEIQRPGAQRSLVGGRPENGAEIIGKNP